jgi:peptide/nickel transport system substrate-binding protein
MPTSRRCGSGQIRSDRAAIEFRSMPPAARGELVKALRDKITVQESDWNVASAATPNHKRKPFTTRGFAGH